MKILASLIKRKLERQTGILGHCAIYEHQLQRLWPLNEKNRKAKIAAFAKAHGLRLIFYKPDYAPCSRKNRMANESGNLSELVSPNRRKQIFSGYCGSATTGRRPSSSTCNRNRQMFPRF